MATIVARRNGFQAYFGYMHVSCTWFWHGMSRRLVSGIGTLRIAEAGDLAVLRASCDRLYALRVTRRAYFCICAKSNSDAVAG